MQVHKGPDPTTSANARVALTKASNNYIVVVCWEDYAHVCVKSMTAIIILVHTHPAHQPLLVCGPKVFLKISHHTRVTKACEIHTVHVHMYLQRAYTC